MKKSVFFFLFIYTFVGNIWAQNNQIIEKESDVPFYLLPDPLIAFDGTPIHSAEEWTNIRRPEVFRTFEREVYGKRPAEIIPGLTYELIKEEPNTYNGKAVRKEIIMKFPEKYEVPDMHILLFLPAKTTGRIPVFLTVNGFGREDVLKGVRNENWPVEEIVDRGYGLAGCYCADMDPESDDKAKSALMKLFFKEGQSGLTADDWGTLAVWGWCLSRTMDYFEMDDQIDETKIVLYGHSRNGKAALWAGAADTRFALVISNNSGCGGAALSRRCFGETVGRINTSFPYWFCGNFKKYNNNEEKLPVDQHLLLVLMAPRPVYVASAEEDLWADPMGEFLSARYATPVYHLFGLKGIETDRRPAIHQPLMNHIGYHIRSGGHAVTLYDWNCFMNFADYHLQQKK